MRWRRRRRSDLVCKSDKVHYIITIIANYFLCRSTCSFVDSFCFSGGGLPLPPDHVHLQSSRHICRSAAASLVRVCRKGRLIINSMTMNSWEPFPQLKSSIERERHRGTVRLMWRGGSKFCPVFLFLFPFCCSSSFWSLKFPQQVFKGEWAMTE